MARHAETLEPVAVLGVGTMGRGMAVSCLRAGIPTVVWDRDPARSHDLTGLGATVAPTAAEAAASAAIVVTMVSDLDAVMSIATDHGMLSALAPGAVWVQMSTIGTGIDRVAELVNHQRPDVALLDAPVSGSKEPAERGELTIFASGPDHTRARVAPLFAAIGQRTVWVGPVGAGSRMKLVANTLLAFKAEGLASAVAVAHSLGLGTDAVIDALGDGPLLSAWDSAKLGRMAKGDYGAQFSLALALKDVHLALATVDASRFEAFAALAHEWERAVARGLGGEDLTVVARALERDGGEGA
ncbi:MAG TPA: NAD(P)-dependent oxidoreductase [Acidimicrobiales bacterium]|nr:NAD(P)-dependent oxidoreductase [Acidimicrobiales bacterium]